MVIQIREDVRISHSEGNFQIERRRVVKEGKNAGQEAWSVVGYYGTLASAARGLFERHVYLLVGDEVKDLKTFAMVIEEVGAEIATACRAAVEEAQKAA